ncbi:MAG: Elongation factor P--(R)-beta-lysine ligase [Turneriella sp.]|nr:Elongation factor P--(R)-beta-lysine ligase [Turneriella sp.]
MLDAVLLRNRAIRTARQFFSKEKILEVMTPKAVACATLEPYMDTVRIDAQNTQNKLFLATSPEFFLKKVFFPTLLENPTQHGIYEITSVFRDDVPSKNHQLEFTMVEWYKKNTSLREILEMASSLILYLGKVLKAPNTPTKTHFFSVEELFSMAGIPFSYENQDATIEKYLQLKGKLPLHLNRMDAATICFNLLFDEFILPQLRSKSGLVAVVDFPEYLGALAFTENGIACRGEIYWQGLELANGYLEEWREDVARDRWIRYNEIRILRGVGIHPIDEELLTILPTMRSVSGIAVGLERVLMALYGKFNASDFLNARF